MTLRAVLCACLVVGCGAATLARGRITHPAALAMNAYSKVLVAGGHLDYELAVLTGIVLRLQELGIDAEQVELENLEPLRQAGGIPPGSAVLVAQASVNEQTRPEWTSQPETVCGAFGCYTDHRTVVLDVPMTHAQFELVLYDGPTARVLRRVAIQARDEGGDYESMRMRVAARLVERAEALFSDRDEIARVELLDVELPGHEEAVELAEEGKWTEARAMLERQARDRAAARLPTEERARLQYNLGQARRFDPASLARDPTHFARAEEALREAARLDPKERYARTLRELHRHRTVHRAWLAQRARSQTQRSSAGVPDPPPAYQAAPGGR